MSAKFLRVAMTVGALLLGAGALAGCNDSTTASAPIGTESVTTTSLKQSASTGSSSSAAPSSSESSEEAEAGASKASESAPETKPNGSTKVPRNFPGNVPAPSGVKLTDKQKAYLADLDRQNVEFKGDTDNNVALTMGTYVCQSREQKTDNTMVNAFVRAAIGPMTESDAEASSKATKVIRAADRNLC
ncbi:hypothetical protein [Gordonia zhaorongruii]|uniref:hypothetical protein n=1 Tax=Gordonia zhaorongruii TaxID=2597659 RepID=UPI00104A066D|nr:hypothetical protein [Gordonia zhaorongruii]